MSNDDLLSAIFSDSLRWKLEGISWPDLIVVSGDLIQGVSTDAENPDSLIQDQYAEVNDFLHKMADKFVSSDRSRVIIVPGNHDVSWSRARRAMDPTKDCPWGISDKAFQPDSLVRWDWENQQAYLISDKRMYESRYDHFRQFLSEFYRDLDTVNFSCQENDLVFFEDLDLGVVIVGFASWYGNDCFCDVGDITPAAMARAQQLLENSSAPLAIAVWHHSIAGGPRAHDYMDARVIHRLIDFGFSVGFHGHQHFADAVPFEIRLPNLTSMVVVAGGSLAVGDSQLPMGEQRQFNIVEIDPCGESLTVHVRAMSNAVVFSGSHRNDFGGNTFIKLCLPRSPSRTTKPTQTQRIDDALSALANGVYQRALDLIAGPEFSDSIEGRLVRIEALDGLGQLDDLIEVLDPPMNPDEATRLISLLLVRDRIAEASEKLKSFSELFDEATLTQLKETVRSKGLFNDIQ